VGFSIANDGSKRRIAPNISFHSTKDCARRLGNRAG